MSPTGAPQVVHDNPDAIDVTGEESDTAPFYYDAGQYLGNWVRRLRSTGTFQCLNFDGKHRGYVLP